MRVTVYVLAHGEMATPMDPPFRVIDLDTLPLPKGVPDHLWLSEQVAFFGDTLLGTPTEFMWLCSGRHDQKHAHWRQTRIADLPMLMPSHDREALCVAREEGIWVQQSDSNFPGMGKLLEEMEQRFAMRRGESCYGNSFCVRREVLAEFLGQWREAFGYFHAKYGTDLPFSDPDQTPIARRRRGGQFYERVAMMVLANLGLTFRQVP